MKEAPAASLLIYRSLLGPSGIHAQKGQAGRSSGSSDSGDGERVSREGLGWERQRETVSQIVGETDRVERGKETGLKKKGGGVNGFLHACRSPPRS